MAAISPCPCAAWKSPTGAGFCFPLELDTPRLMSSCVVIPTQHPHSCSSQSRKTKKQKTKPKPNRQKKPLSLLFLASASPSSSSLSAPASATLPASGAPFSSSLRACLQHTTPITRLVPPYLRNPTCRWPLSPETRRKVWWHPSERPAGCAGHRGVAGSPLRK